jgi:serine/threonine protein kinase
LLLLDHPCIIPFYGFVLPTATCVAKIATVFAPDSLQSVLRARPRWWTSTQRLCTIVGIALAGKLIDSKGLIQRDLKPSNLLLDENHPVKVRDFGTCRFHSPNMTMTGGLGNPMYRAPEMWDDPGKNSE